MGDVITFGQLVGKTEILEVACARCPRHGRYHVDKLIAEYGAGHSIPVWLYAFRLACPLHSTVTIYKRCMAECPQLPALFPAEARPRSAD